MTTAKQNSRATPDRPVSWLTLFFFAAGIFVCAELGRALSPAHGSYVSFWLPTGLYVAMLLLNGSQNWLRIVCATLPANFAFDLLHGTPLLMTSGFYAANTVEAVASAWLVRRFVAREITLTSMREFAGLIAFAAIIGPALGAVIGAATLVAYGFSQSFAHSWMSWCSGNVMAIFLLTPLLLRGMSLKTVRPFFGTRRQMLEALLLVLGMSVLTYRIFLLGNGITSNYKFTLMVFFLWAALRFGVIGASAISLWLAVQVAFYTVHFGSGLSPGQIASGDYIPLMQMFLVVAALTGLVPAIALEERNEFTTKLRASENHLRTMIEAEPECVKLISPTGHLMEMNPAGLAMLEVDTLADAQHCPLLDYLQPEHRNAFRELHEKVMRGGSGRLEFEINGQRGTRRWVETCAAPLSDETGKVIALLGVTRDMTERRRAADDARKSDARLLETLDNMLEGCQIIGFDWRYLYLNKLAIHHSQRTAGELLGRKMTEVYPSIESTPLFALLKRCMAERTAGQMENEFVYPNGEKKWFQLSIQPVPEGVFILSLCITERKQLEEQLRQSQKMEAIGQLSGGVAHDFNNILTAILGNATLLSDPQLERGEAQECLEEIIRAASRAADLTRQLLLFSRKQAMQPAAVDLNHIVSRSIKMLQRILGEDVTLHSECAPGLCPIFADTGMIEQAILNLAVNARDAMPHGGRLIICTSSQTLKNPEAPDGEEARPHACLAVTDTGLGIARETLPHIFEPFFTTKEVGKGTGLGLATVYGIVRQHNGWITVRSEVGHGTTFQIYLPPAIGQPAAPSATPPLNQLPRGTGTILVVEDEPPVRKLVAQLLQRLGYSIVTAANGTEALERWRQHRGKISLVLTDITMPGGMNGHQLAAQLLAGSPQLPVVFMSGYTGNATDAATALAEGENFIRKPFDPKALAEIIRKKMADSKRPADGEENRAEI